jgi:hypothetical protein
MSSTAIYQQLGAAPASGTAKIVCNGNALPCKTQDTCQLRRWLRQLQKLLRKVFGYPRRKHRAATVPYYVPERAARITPCTQFRFSRGERAIETWTNQS